MGSFATAYLIVWLAVALYVVRLGTKQRHLAMELDALKDERDGFDDAERSTSLVA